jgi:hypothetical protein
MEKNFLISQIEHDPTLSLRDRLFGFWLLIWRGYRAGLAESEAPPPAAAPAMPDLRKFGPSIR